MNGPSQIAAVKAIDFEGAQPFSDSLGLTYSEFGQSTVQLADFAMLNVPFRFAVPHHYQHHCWNIQRQTRRYFQNAGNSGMQSRTPARQMIPPEAIEKLLDDIEATQPARVFPSIGPLR